MSCKRIRKKRAFRYEVALLRDYVTGKPRMYRLWQIERLRAFDVKPQKHMSRYKAARMVRDRDRREVAEMRGMIKTLTADIGDIRFVSKRKDSASPLDTIFSWRPGQ